mmetsp:Transcript_11375/g.25489  ORF Transcript_11375/g.25489 Transcript_11375/m.25489 type:complete len:291 (+) Transcript_11375:3-875(+)
MRESFPSVGAAVPLAAPAATPAVATVTATEKPSVAPAVEFEAAATTAPVAAAASSPPPAQENEPGSPMMEEACFGAPAKPEESTVPSRAVRARRLSAWLASARCRLAAKDYDIFRRALGSLHHGRAQAKAARRGASSQERLLAGELKTLARVLWRAEFPEGPRAQAAWVVAFEDSLPRSLRGAWRNRVDEAAPLGLKLRSVCQGLIGIFARKGKPPAEVAAPCGSVSRQTVPAATPTAPVSAAASPGIGAQAPKKQRLEGWLISRSAAFLRRSESTLPSTVPGQAATSGV